MSKSKWPHKLSHRAFFLFGSSVILAGCASSVPLHVPATSAANTSAPAAPSYDRSGLGAVLGQDDATLIARFGTPRLNIQEGQARRLQFSGAACVMDVYLFPPDNGGEPVANHIDARDRNGADVDRLSCIEALAR